MFRTYVKLMTTVYCLFSMTAALAEDLEIDAIMLLVEDGGRKESIKMQNSGFYMPPYTIKHEGQGTSAVFVSFRNMYIGMGWVDDMDELEKNAPYLKEKYKNLSGAGSPFGFALRRNKPGKTKIPFETFKSTAEWMPPGKSVEVASTEEINEPYIIVGMEGRSWPEQIEENPTLSEEVNHALDVNYVTKITLFGPKLDKLNDASKYVHDHTIVTIKPHDQHLMHLYFDDESQGKTLDLRPEIPIVIYY